MYGNYAFVAAMIHWTRQTKEVLSAQDALQTSENAGPLEEIDFWKNRFALVLFGTARLFVTSEFQLDTSYRLRADVPICLASVSSWTNPE